ncbi:MAG TPA: NifB/NifX family molybdenum-iron cluster-binding protein [Desulfosarcina sp.]|nr:NifB/NifX family molybdenum-iron cluster-binding protein [Desulfosarcina sp.]
MKIAVSAEGKDLDSTVHQRFGRCPYFLIVETDDMTVDVIENSQADLSTGAGIQAAGMLIDKGAETVVTGNCGPNATKVFDGAGISVILDQQGVIRQVVERLRDGALSTAVGAKASRGSSAQPLATRAAGGRDGRDGVGAGRGMGGCGRGLGMGGGRGMGRCRTAAQDTGSPVFGQPPGNSTRQGEVSRLQQQADACRRQLADLEARIKSLS